MALDRGVCHSYRSPSSPVQNSRASEVAKLAAQSGRSVREVLLEDGYLSADEVDDLLSIESMTAPRPLPRRMKK